MEAVLKQPRLSLPEYLQLVKAHFLGHWKAYTLPLLALFILQFFIRLDVNLTESLPDKVFLTVKGMTSDIKKGDYIAFEYQGSGATSPFPKGFHFVKIVGATPGDLITMDDTLHFYRGSSREGTSSLLGLAKPISKLGKPLAPGPVGVIPDGQYYVYAPHPDSLDSRYALTGWVRQEHVIGKTFALF